MIQSLQCTPYHDIGKMKLLCMGKDKVLCMVFGEEFHKLTKWLTLLQKILQLSRYKWAIIDRMTFYKNPIGILCIFCINVLFLSFPFLLLLIETNLPSTSLSPRITLCSYTQPTYYNNLLVSWKNHMKQKIQTTLTDITMRNMRICSILCG